ncbi:MAG: hypothetical protein KGM47_05145 [Acidobacteriota bacterium]|nr:hypothetical protein [Acidobacteriota bacterium]
MICPICQKRKAKRFCPAKAATICAICCGTEREVTIDCPSDCAFLIASRRHYEEEHILKRDRPFPDEDIHWSVVEKHEQLFIDMSYVVCEFAAANPSIVDSDVEAVYKALAETYQTLAKGVLYENPPAYPLQRELYNQLRDVVHKYKGKQSSGLVAVTGIGDSQVRDALIMFTQLAAGRSNGRPKGRAFIDSIRSQFKPGTFDQPASRIILAP